jgi:hypothetical protein
VTVRNVYEGPDGPPTGKPVTLTGKLDGGGECNVDIPASQVADWLDPEKPLGGCVNEVLIDCSFQIPDVTSEGKPIAGQSENRVYLYRRKAIVFLPGVFGSSVNVTLADGSVHGFPSFIKDKTVGELECDENGEPLIEANPPTLVELWALKKLKKNVYDIENACEDARREHYPQLDKHFGNVQMVLHCYDWRLDLTEAAEKLATDLRGLCAELRKRADFDDQVAVAGHSTGGLIIRRALGCDGMDDHISHAFFLNVPFRGAPKAMGVLLTGQDPPGGDPMVPIVDADSLRNVALSMPIVYHLAPATAYGERVAISPTRPASASADVSKDKRAFVGAAIECGIRSPPTFVKKGLAAAEASAIAADSDRWHEFWNEAAEYRRAEAAYKLTFPDGWPAYDGWLDQETSRADNQRQADARVAGGWSDGLAKTAQDFHDASEKIASGAKWKDRAFVFYSVHPQLRTTLRVTVEEDESAKRHVTSAYNLTGVVNGVFLSGKQRTARPKNLTQSFAVKGAIGYAGTSPLVMSYQWSLTQPQRGILERAWKLWAECVPAAGDGTVPTQSLLGFGGDCTVFKQLEYCDDLADGGMAHVPAPNHPDVWRRIHRAMQGVVLAKDVESGSPKGLR